MGLDIVEGSLLLRALLDRDEIESLWQASRATAPTGDLGAAESGFFSDIADSELGRYLLGDD